MLCSSYGSRWEPRMPFPESLGDLPVDFRSTQVFGGADVAGDVVVEEAVLESCE